MTKTIKADYVLVGAGLANATLARILTDKGYKCIVMEEKEVGGMAYTYRDENIDVHKYGPHIFHTNNPLVWDFVNRFANFKPYKHVIKADYNGKLYSLPFSLLTLKDIYGQGVLEIPKNKIKDIKEPKNLEEQALSTVGEDIYNILIKGYTEKQWNKKCKELPPEIIKRIPIRNNFEESYFNDKYQGIPEEGFTKFIENMLDGIEIINEKFTLDTKVDCKNIIYSGAIDELLNYKLGKLEWRSLRFEHEKLDIENYQDYTIINYTSKDIPYTRITENKKFKPHIKTDKTIITKEYPDTWEEGKIRYYPVNTEKNNMLFTNYLSILPKNIFLNGRLGLYMYMNMTEVIEKSFELANELLK